VTGGHSAKCSEKDQKRIKKNVLMEPNKFMKRERNDFFGGGGGVPYENGLPELGGRGKVNRGREQHRGTSVGVWEEGARIRHFDPKKELSSIGKIHD